MVENRIQVLSVLRLLLSSQKWMYSRKETISWESAAIVTRNIQVDFSLQTWNHGALDELTHLYVPLALVRKTHESASLSVIDEAGGRVAYLSIAESMRYAEEMMVALVEEASSASEDSDTEKWRDYLHEVAFAKDSADASTALQAIERLQEDFGAGDISVLLSLAKVFAESFPLLIEVEAADRSHRSLLFTTSAPMFRTPERLSAIPRLLGWTASSLVIALSNLGQSRDYEVIVQPPDGTEISLARLMTSIAGRLDGEVHSGGDFLGPGRVRFVRLGVIDVPPNTNGVLVIDLAPNRSYSAGVLATAVLAALMLTVGWLCLPTVMMSDDAATTLLLAGPTLFSAVVARPGRGSTGTQFLVAARAVLLLTGLLTFIAAGALIASDCESTLRSIWLGLAVTAWLCSGILGVAVIAPGVGRRARRARSKASLARPIKSSE